MWWWRKGGAAPPFFKYVISSSHFLHLPAREMLLKYSSIISLISGLLYITECEEIDFYSIGANNAGINISFFL